MPEKLLFHVRDEERRTNLICVLKQPFLAGFFEVCHFVLCGKHAFPFAAFFFLLLHFFFYCTYDIDLKWNL